MLQYKLVFTPTITANVRHASLHECDVSAMRKKLKLSSDDGDSGSKKCQRGNGGTCGVVWRSLLLVGVWSQEVSFSLVHLAGIWLQSP
jgi:hypothetical protein